MPLPLPSSTGLGKNLEKVAWVQFLSYCLQVLRVVGQSYLSVGHVLVSCFMSTCTIKLLYSIKTVLWYSLFEMEKSAPEGGSAVLGYAQ